MKLERRLLLYGVVLPGVLMALSLVAVGALLWAQLVSGVDHSLRAQATAESVSLFDGPDGRAHFHAVSSPLRSALGHPDAAIAIYDAHGTRLEASDPTIAPRRVALPPDTRPRFRTAQGARQLVLRITSPEGVPYALWLSRSLDEEVDMIAAYARYSTSGLLAFVALLALVQRRHARWLARRVGALAGHMGRIRAGDLSAVPAPDPVPDVLGQLRDAVARATDQLREMHRAREHFVAGAAHELRTPLAAMRASVDVALRRDRSPEELRQVLGEVGAEVDRLDSLATELLDLASVGARELTKVSVDLGDLARASARRFEAEARSKGVTLEVVGSACGLRLVPDLVSRALDNVVSNALRFAPAGTRVCLELTDAAHEKVVQVRDEGPGITAEDLEVVFTPFHRLDRRGDGRGLGLALVREIAELHGGSARALPSPRGAVIELRFPVTGVRTADTSPG